MSAKSETRDNIGRRLVHFGQLFTDVGFGNAGFIRMKNIHDLKNSFIQDNLSQKILKTYHLLTAKKPIGHNFPRAQSNDGLALKIKIGPKM